MAAGDDEATVIIPRSPQQRRSRPPTALVGVAVAAVAAIVILAVLVWPSSHPAPPPAVPESIQPPAQTRAIQPLPAPAPAMQRAAPPPEAAAPSPASRFTIATADERTILSTPATTLLVFRFSDDPNVVVLSYPSLQAQGRMLNRIGAFVEKAGMPHDRVVTDAELAAAMARTHDTEDTYYYGHDYRAADLARFFRTAARDGIPLRPEETVLHALLEQEGLLAPGAVGAVISIPPESQSPAVDPMMRAAILHHELSHGLYFTDPAYAAYSRVFWDTVLTDAQRAGFRRFLANEGYDTGIEDLMINETQAYLVHTPDRRFFRAELAGLTEATADSLRQRFARDMPTSWLKTQTLARLGGR